MAILSETFDVRIRVIFPLLTKSLPQDDSNRINATGAFSFSPAPQVETKTQGEGRREVQEDKPEDKVKLLKDGLENLLQDFEKIQEAMKKKSKHISLDYNPELAQNEALAAAEAEIFGFASGHITYEMFEKTVEFQDKINKYISHTSIENEGILNGIVA